MVAEAASDRHLQIRLRGMVKVFDTEWAAAMPKRLRPSSPISLPRFNLRTKAQQARGPSTYAGPQ